MAPKTKTATAKTKEPELPEIVLVGYGAMKGKTLKAFVVSQDEDGEITLRVPNPSKPTESKDYAYSAETGRVENADPKKGMEISAADLEQFQSEDEEDEDEEDEEDEDEEDEEDEDEEFEIPEVGDEVTFEKDEKELTGEVVKVDESGETCDIKVGSKTYRKVSFDDLLEDEEEEADEEEADAEEADEEEGDEDEELVPEIGDHVFIEVAGKEAEGEVVAVNEDDETADVKVGKKTHKGISWDDIEYPAEDEDEEEEEEEEEVPEPPKRGRGRPSNAEKAAATAAATPAGKRPLTGAAAAAAAKKAESADKAPKVGPNELELRIPDGMYNSLMTTEVTKKKARDENHAAMQAALKSAVHSKWWHGIFDQSAAQGLVDAFGRAEPTWNTGGVAGAGMVRAAARLKTEIQEKWGKKVRISAAGAPSLAQKPLPTKPAVSKPAASTAAPAASKSGLPARSGRRRAKR